MLTPLSGRPQELRVLIADFLSARRDSKLDKLAPDDPKRSEVLAQFQHAAWIDNAVRRVGQLEVVTHSIKLIHPDAKGTSLNRPPTTLAKRAEVGTHCLDGDFALDVVGNAAALDVHGFLKLTHQNRTLLDLVLSKDPDLALALSIDPEQANAWIDAFAGIVEPRGKVASHFLAKQIYWLTGDNPLDNGDYYLLAPLFASVLTHRVFQTIYEHRFGDAAKAARKAKSDRLFTAQVVYEYREMAVQQLGGSNPQNAGSLNKERNGNNYLLASLPPIWKSSGAQPLLHGESMFRCYGARPEVLRTVEALLAFFKSPAFLKLGYATKQENDTRRDDLVGALIDELIQFTAELRTLPPGWTQSPDCDLSDAEKRWLDPTSEDDTSNADDADEVGKSFARWLNDVLRKDKLPVGDAEYQYWRALVGKQLRDDDLEVKP